MTIALDRITTTAARTEGGVKRHGIDDAGIRALDDVDVGLEVAPHRHHAAFKLTV